MGLGFRIANSGFRVLGVLGFGVWDCNLVGLGFRGLGVSGLGL